MSTSEDIHTVREQEEGRGRRTVARDLTIATPPRREPELTTPQIKVQRFGALITRIGEAIEGVPAEIAAEALTIVLGRVAPPPATAPAPAAPVATRTARRSARDPQAPAQRARAQATPGPRRAIHASGSGQAAAVLLTALQKRRGEATTRQLATDVGKSVSTVTHTLRAMAPRVERPSRGVWRLARGGS